MSKVIWTPNGNMAQTGIDMELASLESQRDRALFEISTIRKNLICIEEDLYELRACLEQLKGDVLIVSISEFGIIKENYRQSIINRDRQLDLIRTINEAVIGYEDRMSKLEVIREESATKILEFKPR